MRSMKRDHKLANVNFEIVKYVADDCSTNILKKSRPKSAKMAELGTVKNSILIKTILKFMNRILGIFGKKLILKHFMHRTIPKKGVLGVF